MVLICIPLVISDIGHDFMCLLALCISSLQMSIKVFCLIFDWIACFFGIEFYELFVYFEYQLLVCCIIYNISCGPPHCPPETPAALGPAPTSPTASCPQPAPSEGTGPTAKPARWPRARVPGATPGTRPGATAQSFLQGPSLEPPHRASCRDLDLAPPRSIGEHRTC